MADLHAAAQRHMEARGMSLRALARAVHHDPSYVSKALRGVKPCGPKLAQAIDAALGADGEIVRAAAQRDVPTEDYLPRQSGRDAGSGLPRRDFVVLAMTVTALLDVLRNASPGLPDRLAHSARVDDATAAGLENMMLGYRQVYQSAGAAALLDPVCGTLNLLTELAPSAGRHRDRIVSMIGQASSLAATMLMLDSGDYAGSSRYLALAARSAQQCGDAELLAVTMAARAFREAYSGAPRDGLAFAREAVSVASSGGVHPRTRGWVCAVESEMHATVGDEAAYARSVDAAAGHLDAPMPGSQWKGIGTFTPAKLTAYRGAGLMRLHRYRQAQDVLLDALSALDPVQAKHRCTAHIDLSDAYARDRKPDEAAHHAISALAIIEQTRHAESMKRVAAIYQAVRPAGTASTRELASRLLAARASSAG